MEPLIMSVERQLRRRVQNVLGNPIYVGGPVYDVYARVTRQTLLPVIRAIVSAMPKGLIP